MENTKNCECYMFACGDEYNVVIEAENKMDAIEIFKKRFKMRFLEDWQVFKVTVGIDIGGNSDWY